MFIPKKISLKRHRGYPPSAVLVRWPGSHRHWCRCWCTPPHPDPLKRLKPKKIRGWLQEVPYYIYIYTYVCVYISPRVSFPCFKRWTTSSSGPLFFGCLYQCRFSMSEMFSWNIPMKTRQQAKVWHDFLAKFYHLASFHFLLIKIGKNIRGNQKSEEVSLRHPPPYSHGQKLLKVKQLLGHCHCCNLEKLSAITKISHLGRCPKVVLFLGEIKNSMQVL